MENEVIALNRIRDSLRYISATITALFLSVFAYLGLGAVIGGIFFIIIIIAWVFYLIYLGFNPIMKKSEVEAERAKMK